MSHLIKRHSRLQVKRFEAYQKRFRVPNVEIVIVSPCLAQQYLFVGAGAAVMNETVNFKT